MKLEQKTIAIKKALAARHDSRAGSRLANIGIADDGSGVMHMPGMGGMRGPSPNHPNMRAVAMVRTAMGALDIPSQVSLRLSRFHTIARGTPNETKIVTVLAGFRSLSGPKYEIEVPVVFRGEAALEPSVFRHEGNWKVLEQQAIDDIISRGTFTRPMPDRESMYHAPSPGAGAGGVGPGKRVHNAPATPFHFDAALTEADPCPTCQGTGGMMLSHDPNADVAPCPDCGGTGELQIPTSDMPQWFAPTAASNACPKCEGKESCTCKKHGAGAFSAEDAFGADEITPAAEGASVAAAPLAKGDSFKVGRYGPVWNVVKVNDNVSGTCQRDGHVRKWFGYEFNSSTNNVTVFPVQQGSGDRAGVPVAHGPLNRLGEDASAVPEAQREAASKYLDEYWSSLGNKGR